MTTVNIDLSVQQPLVELDVAAGQAVLVPKISATDLSKMEELAAAAAASETAASEQAQAAKGSATTANEKAQAAQGSAATASESASNAGEHAVAAGQQAQAAQNSATTAGGHAQAASESAATTGQHAATASAQAQAAQSSATTAGGHAVAAKGSADTASEKAQSARESATTAGLALTSMQGMVDAADNSAKAAKLAESAVNESASNIEILTLSAQASATTAQAAKSESQQAAAAATGSAVNAKASETAALAASQAAQVSAVTVNEAVAVAGGHATAAQASATTAGGAATTAQASATNAQASAQAAAKSLSDMALLVGGNDDLYAKMRLYTQSRLGLIANGSGGMGDNYNFSTMTYTQKDVYFGRGAFISNTLGGIHTTDEKIPLEPDSNYEFSVYARCLEKGDATSTAQGINLARCFDVDGLDILPQHVGMITVKLGAPLQNGDTTVTIHPDDRERMRVWVAANSNGGNVHVANPDYVNSKGYRYERGTYVREIYNTGAATPGASLLYDAGSGVLRMFTINAAPAGGVASNGSITFTKTGSVYVYAIGNMNGTAIPTDKWQRFSGRFSTNTLRPGTAEIVIGCQLNRSSRYGTKTALSAMSLHKVF